ncbi:MAG: hydrolase [Ruminiclostridium sp.]|nr:hydrolase [Ruminiclostridium sp.]
MTGKLNTSSVLRRAFALVCLVSAMLCLSVSSAWAADGDTAKGSPDLLNSDKNAINTQQLPDNSFLYDTSIYDLTNTNTAYDKKTVQVTGEVVGDALRELGTPNKYWIMLASTDPQHEATVSVLINAEDLELIDMYGGYGRKGTELQVQGEFNLSCGVHEGAIDIHANNVKAVEPGLNVKEPFEFQGFLPGIVLVAIAAGLTVYYYRQRERLR